MQKSSFRVDVMYGWPLKGSWKRGPAFQTGPRASHRVNPALHFRVFNIDLLQSQNVACNIVIVIPLV